MGDLKQVLLIRTDLGMGKGKIIAQAAHASCEAVFRSNKKLVSNWHNSGMKKVALKVDNYEELKELLNKAENLDLTTSLIQDAGKTQVEPGTYTCGAIGPGPANLIDKVTSHLKLM